MSWDAALADEKTGEFQVELKALAELLERENGPVGVETLHLLQTLWQKYYRTTGHKRLARVFLKEVFE